MTRRPVPRRLILAVALITLIVVGACGAGIHWAGRRAVYLQQVNDLDHVAMLLRQSVTGDGSHLPESDRARLADMAHVLGVRVTPVGGSGNVLLDTDATADLMDNHNARPEIALARSSGEGDFARRSHTLDEWSVYVARLLDPARPAGTVVRVSQWRYPPPLLVGSLVAVAGSASVAAAGVGLALWLLLRNQWVAPLRTLQQAVREIAAGDWDRRVPAGGAEDVRVLCAELHDMAQAGRRQAAELRDSRESVRSLAATMPDAVLVSDSDSRVTLLNAPAADLLGLRVEQAVGKRLVDVLADEALRELFESVRPKAEGSASATAHSDLKRQVRIFRDGRHITLQAHIEQADRGGVLLVLRDISTLAETVQMKADFVANASHELRTPIAAIKIAFETLREVYAEDAGQTERCLQIIDGHMTRLEEMLRDLLDLSRVESAEMKPQIRRMDSGEVTAALRSALGPLASTKGVNLLLEEDDSIEIVADEGLLNLVLKNLVENSIKFTPAGGSVSLTIRQEANNAGALTLTIHDTGVGIPPEHLERVFERFYQVNPARSGSAGRGTGLGLAIVKHAVHAMGGTVQIRSTVGRGTVVTCVIPQDATTRLTPALDLPV